MKKLTVSSLPLRSVISDIAREFDTEYRTSCGIHQVKVPERLGKGEIIATDFNDGLGLIRYDCTFKQDLVMEYSIDEVHPVKFLFCTEGEIKHKFLNEDTWHEIPKFRNAVVASSAHHGHCVRFIAGEAMVYNSMELDRRRFQSKISCDPISIAKSWRDMLNDVSAKKTFYYDGFYSLRMANLFDAWDEFTDEDWLMKLNLEGMAYDILVQQIKQFQDDIKAEGSKTVLRRSELNQIVKVVNIIEERMDDLPTIADMADEVGLNPNKLQQGFKEIFGTTVNLYIKKKRLEMARTLLKNTDHKLYVIADSVGYKSQSYFSKKFQEMYGIQPSDYRKNREHRKILPLALQDGE